MKKKADDDKAANKKQDSKSKMKRSVHRIGDGCRKNTEKVTKVDGKTES